MPTNAEWEIAQLDDSLAKDGDWIILRRVVGTGASTVNVDVKCRAWVRPVKSDEVIGTIEVTASSVIMSPTQITRAQWPGGQPPTLAAPYNPDPRLPKVNDKAIIQGRPRNISFVKPIVDGELIRIELTVAG